MIADEFLSGNLILVIYLREKQKAAHKIMGKFSFCRRCCSLPK